MATINIADWLSVQCDLSLFLGLAAVSCVGLYFILQWRDTKLPPSYGWIPFIGCAVEFGKHPLQFIKTMQEKLGDVYTLHVAGKKLTFLCDPADYHYFFASNHVDFQSAVQRPVQRTANVPKRAFFKSHSKIHDAVKGRLARQHLPSITAELGKKFSDRLHQWPSTGEDNLADIIRRTMYRGVLDHLFGDGVLPTTSEKEFEQLEKNFVMFDDQFEYGSQLPEVFLSDWSKSKRWLLALFHKIVPALSKAVPKPTLLQTLIKELEGEYAPNFGLLFMWASLANAIPITFWTVAYILNNKTIYSNVLQELQNVHNQSGKDVLLTEKDLSRLPHLRRCMLEAIRLRPPGVITRMVTKPLNVKGYHIPAGHQLMVSPYWTHRNPDLFPNPDTYHPDRWLQFDLDKHELPEGFIAFGGGRYQCPGRVDCISWAHNSLWILATFVGEDDHDVIR